MVSQKVGIWRLALGAVPVALLLSLSTTASAWIAYGGHEYQFTTAAPWANAETQAAGWGGYLVAIGSQAEQNWLVATFGSSERLYIGFNDIAVEGTWVWTSGDPVTYTNWDSGEPNNFLNEDWAVMNWDAPGNWNDWNVLSGGGCLRGIAERSGQGSDIPEPATLALLGLGGLAAVIRRRLAG